VSKKKRRRDHAMIEIMTPETTNEKEDFKEPNTTCPTASCTLNKEKQKSRQFVL
jgi:hypothetical protein